MANREDKKSVLATPTLKRPSVWGKLIAMGMAASVAADIIRPLFSEKDQVKLLAVAGLIAWASNIWSQRDSTTESKEVLQAVRYQSESMNLLPPPLEPLRKENDPALKG